MCFWSAKSSNRLESQRLCGGRCVSFCVCVAMIAVCVLKGAVQNNVRLLHTRKRRFALLQLSTRASLRLPNLPSMSDLLFVYRTHLM
jgi:hypothetical protein